jgi:hypothetical protein
MREALTSADFMAVCESVLRPVASRGHFSRRRTLSPSGSSSQDTVVILCVPLDPSLASNAWPIDLGFRYVCGRLGIFSIVPEWINHSRIRKNGELQYELREEGELYCFLGFLAHAKRQGLGLTKAVWPDSELDGLHLQFM